MNISITSARRGLALLTSALLAALALLALTSGHSRAAADPYPPTNSCAISTLNHSVQPGDTINLNGSGFAANSTVTLTLHSTPMSLGTVHTDGTGAFTDSVTIPSSLTGTSHTIVASSPSVTCSMGLSATKGVDAVSTSKPTSGTDALATTGFAAMTASVIAVALLAGGALLLVLGRRRRQL